MMEEFPRTHVHPMYIACIDRMIPEFLRGVLPERRKIHGDGSRVNPACYRATQIFLRANPPSSFLAQRFISTKSRIKIGLRKGRYVVGWNFTDLDHRCAKRRYNARKYFLRSVKSLINSVKEIFKFLPILVLVVFKTPFQCLIN